MVVKYKYIGLSRERLTDLIGSETYREWCPCIGRKQWHEVLCQNGFSGVEIALRDYVDDSAHEMGLIISTVKEAAVNSVPTQNVAIIVKTTSTLQAETAHQVRTYLQSAGCFSCDIISLQEAALGSQRSNTEFCVFLLELEKPFLYSLDQERYTMLRAVLLSACQLLWVTSGGRHSEALPDFGLISGLARVLRSENNKLVFITLALANDVGSRPKEPLS